MTGSHSNRGFIIVTDIRRPRKASGCREIRRQPDDFQRQCAAAAGNRDPLRIDHPLKTLVSQRVMALALGYEDINDHDRLRDDTALALACGCADVTGATRWPGQAR